jgi:predicted nuclease of restriction endonuclease-like (RecB) superfamily
MPDEETSEMNPSALALPADYAQWLASLKQRIQGARQRALLAANSEQIRLYHDIGREILDRQSQQGWGAKVIDQLSADLRAAFPDMKGLSSRNLKYMKVFAQECPDLQIGQQSAAQLPWFHIVTLITKVSDHSLREWYAREALAQSWPRDTLNIQIKSQLHLRKGAAVTNFDQRLAPPHAGLAKRSVAEVGAIGRNINQIARAVNQQQWAGGPNRGDLLSILRALMALRNHTKALINANLASWETGYDKASR